MFKAIVLVQLGQPRSGLAVRAVGLRGNALHSNFYFSELSNYSLLSVCYFVFK